jgi:nitrous oxidase accessory protein NosD
VRAAEPGGTVTVAPGECRERLILDRPILIQAEGGPGTVRLVGGDGPALTLLAAEGTVRGLRVEGGGGTWAVLAERGAVTLSDCEIHGGVRVGGRARPVLRDCRVGGRGSLPAAQVGMFCCVVSAKDETRCCTPPRGRAD